MTLIEFLHKRIDDDERWAQMAGHGFGHQPIGAERNAGWTDIEVVENCRPSYDAGFIERNSPDRVRAECAAKRRIIAELEPWVCKPEPAPGAPGCHFDTVLGLLAQPYANHPDFDPEWKF